MIKAAKYPLVDLFESGVKVGIIEDYNPKQHAGLVVLDAVGIKEYGALPSNYVAMLDGVKIPNKWDNKKDYNKIFFGE